MIECIAELRPGPKLSVSKAVVKSILGFSEMTNSFNSGNGFLNGGVVRTAVG